MSSSPTTTTGTEASAPEGAGTEDAGTEDVSAENARAGRSIPVRVLAALVASIAIALVALGIASATGATMLVTTPGSPEPLQINAGQVVVSLAMPMLIVGALLWWLGRSRPALVRWIAWIGLAFGVLSAPMPFSATSDLPTALALAAMHAVAGIAWFVALTARSRR
ncbi:DUF6069 family protein [Agromyces subbeticus]|uniref:DUF6069 family protein n=1 Tax=Agromyces subbeticus TaxID=293890 RepID=UPI0003B6AB18|nr:DUF6069 family protein [Agromyces subbeticus]